LAKNPPGLLTYSADIFNGAPPHSSSSSPPPPSSDSSGNKAKYFAEDEIDFEGFLLPVPSPDSTAAVPEDDDRIHEVPASHGIGIGGNGMGGEGESGVPAPSVPLEQHKEEEETKEDRAGEMVSEKEEKGEEEEKEPSTTSPRMLLPMPSEAKNEAVLPSKGCLLR
jgi:hypothetical protein